MEKGCNAKVRNVTLGCCRTKDIYAARAYPHKGDIKIRDIQNKGHIHSCHRQNFKKVFKFAGGL